MKFILLVFVTLITTWAQAQSALSGYLNKSPTGQWLLVLNDKEFTLNARRNVSEQLNKLDAGDIISGTGIVNNATDSIELLSIDYVGLKKILGLWFSREGLIEFKNFTTLNFYPRQKASGDYLVSKAYLVDYQQQYRYSMTPSNGREWTLYLTDKKATSLGTLIVDGNIAVLKIYDSNTGDLVKALRLSRLQK